MKIIFLDIDGVLNGYNYWNTLGWKIISSFHNRKLKNLYRTISDPFGVHKRKVKRLGKIVKKTNAKVVMSSSWRIGLSRIPYDELTSDYKKLLRLFNKYNIDVIDITPIMEGRKRDQEILSWISDHKEHIDAFIILDDENRILREFDNDERFIQTSSVPKGVMIKGHWQENTGLKNKHVKQAIRILNKKEI